MSCQLYLLTGSYDRKDRLLVRQTAEKRPSAALSGRLTVLAAWQEVAPYSSRRHPSSFVVAAYVQVRLTFQDFGRLASGHF
jgi:hypothetical protein